MRRKEIERKGREGREDIDAVLENWEIVEMKKSIGLDGKRKERNGKEDKTRQVKASRGMVRARTGTARKGNAKQCKTTRK